MCGIAGWIDWETDLTGQAVTLETMTGALSCHGPDGHEMWLSRRAALGHRQLNVIESASGGQPMRRQRGEYDVLLLYDGELYNTSELRQELAGRGHTFEGRSDAEALMSAYVEWDVACVERFNGTFAFAIWDEGAGRLVLGRDRSGERSLFYAARGEGLIFASELKALLVHPFVHPETAGERVDELKPSHFLTYDRKRLRTHSY